MTDVSGEGKNVGDVRRLEVGNDEGTRGVKDEVSETKG